MVTTYQADLVPSEDDSTTPRMRFLCGGAGGLAPILVSLILADAALLAMSLRDPYFLAGFGVRSVGLFMLGGLWAWMHVSEHDPKKLFQLGIVAPAMIIGMIHASDAAKANGLDGASAAPAFSFSIISSAYANEHTTSQERTDEPSPTERFIKGLLGRR